MSNHVFTHDKQQYDAFCEAIRPQPSIATFKQFAESDIGQLITLAKFPPLEPLTYNNQYNVDTIGREPLLFDDHPETALFKRLYNTDIQVVSTNTASHYNTGTIDVDCNLNVATVVAREYVDTNVVNYTEINQCYIDSDEHYDVSQFSVNANESKRLGLYDGRVQHSWCKGLDLGWRVTFTSHFEHLITGNKIYVFFPLSSSIQYDLFMEGENTFNHTVRYTTTKAWINVLSLCKLRWANVLENQCIYIPAGYRYNSFPVGIDTAHSVVRDLCSYLDGLYLVATRMYVVHILQNYRLLISGITPNIIQTLSHIARHVPYKEFDKRFQSMINKCVVEISNTMNRYCKLASPDSGTQTLVTDINDRYEVEITFDGAVESRSSQLRASTKSKKPTVRSTRLSVEPVTTVPRPKRNRIQTDFYAEEIPIPQKRARSTAQQSEQLANIGLLTRGQLDTKTATILKKVTRYTFRDAIVPFMTTLRLRPVGDRGVANILRHGVMKSQQRELFSGTSIVNADQREQVQEDLLQLQRIKGHVTNARMDILFEQGRLYRLYIKHTTLIERKVWLKQHHLHANNWWNNVVNLYQLTREYPNFRHLDFSELPVEVTESTIIHNAVWFRDWLREQFRLPHDQRVFLDILRTDQQALLDQQEEEEEGEEENQPDIDDDSYNGQPHIEEMPD